MNRRVVATKKAALGAYKRVLISGSHAALSFDPAFDGQVAAIDLGKKHAAVIVVDGLTADERNAAASSCKKRLMAAGFELAPSRLVSADLMKRLLAEAAAEAKKRTPSDGGWWASLFSRIKGGDTPEVKEAAKPAQPDATAASRESADTQQPSVITSLTQLGSYKKVLTTGDNPLIVLDPRSATLVTAVDQGEMEAAILVVAGAAAEVVNGPLRTINAKLLGGGYNNIKKLEVSERILKEVLATKSADTSSASQGEAIELFRRIVRLAIEQGGSDIHIEFDKVEAKVRVRVDDELRPLADGGDGRYGYAAALNAVAAGYNTTNIGNSMSQYEPTRALDCIIRESYGAEDVDLRYQSIAGRDGPKVIMRVQRQSDRRTQGTFASAGYTPSQQRLWLLAARSGKGCIVITGAVNSGKSSSLQTFMETFPDKDVLALYTVEDPIERKITGTHQIEVLRDPTDPKGTERKYGEVIRALLRGDMDAVMVGEIRDELTANFMLMTGQTGHLAMATLHTNDIASIVPRLTNSRMGLTRQELCAPKVLNLLVNQSLLPKLCSHCRLPAMSQTADDAELAHMLGVLRSKFKLDPARFFVKNPKGCVHCKHRGTTGRVVVAEMWQPDRKWLDLTRAGDDHGALNYYRSLGDGDFTSENMTGKTTFDHALLRAWRGQVDLWEVFGIEDFNRYELPPRAAR